MLINHINLETIPIFRSHKKIFLKLLDEPKTSINHIFLFKHPPLTIYLFGLQASISCWIHRQPLLTVFFINKTLCSPNLMESFKTISFRENISGVMCKVPKCILCVVCCVSRLRYNFETLYNFFFSFSFHS